MNELFARRSRRGRYSKLYLRTHGGEWLLIAWGVHSDRPHWQERTPRSKR